MTRITLILCILASVAACTRPSTTDGRVRDSNPRFSPEPTTPGINVSGHVIIGVSTEG